MVVKSSDMKRIINIFITSLSVLMLLASCEKAPMAEEGIVAEWQLTEMTGYENADLPSVYVEFRADKAFVIYQKVGEVMRYRKYTGEYSISGTTLTGKYSDGEDLGSAYKVSFEADGGVLVLTALETDKSGNVLSEGEVCKYVKASLSQEEKDAADVVTKSEGETFLRFL